MKLINTRSAKSKLTRGRGQEVSHFGGGRSNLKNRFVKGVIKLCLNLTILVGLVLLVRFGYQLLTTHSEDPLKGSILLILGFVAWIVVVMLSRSRSRYYWLRYKGVKPSFKLSAFSVIAILLVFAFAGVQPFVDYKDRIVNSAVGTVDEWREQVAVREAEREVEKVEQEVAETVRLAEEYSVLFNDIRAEHGLQPLTFDSRLNELAKVRCAEISQPGNFSHEGIEGYGLGENIAMMAYSSDSNTDLLELWAGSSGHRANMLGSQYTRTGFARVGRYAVQLFGW